MPEDMKASELLPLVTEVVAAKLSNGKTASSEVALIRLPVDNRGATQELVNGHDKCRHHRHPEQDGEQLPEASS